jgi:hypothetical protein
MKRKNKILIKIIAAVLFIVGFILSGCDKSLPGTMDKRSSIQRNSPSTPTVIPTATQNVNTAFNPGKDSLLKDVRYDLKGYGTYAP